VFGPIIAPQLHLIHHGTQHLGKTPRRHANALQREELRAALTKAISTEDFEQAAQLRDQLSLLPDA
jgi:protein-arginine kinase activator protein McsA